MGNTTPSLCTNMSQWSAVQPCTLDFGSPELQRDTELGVNKPHGSDNACHLLNEAGALLDTALAT